MIYVNPNGSIDLGDNSEKAAVRVVHAMTTLNRLRKKGGTTLETAAQAVVAANTLLSAYSLIYDRLYELSQRTGVIGRTPEHPMPTAKE